MFGPTVLIAFVLSLGAVAAVQTPAERGDGTYVVITNDEGVDEYVSITAFPRATSAPLASIADAGPVPDALPRSDAKITYDRAARSPIERRKLSGATCNALPDNDLHCDEGRALPANDYFAAFDAWKAECNTLGDTHITANGRAVMIQRGEAIFFMCNYKFGWTQCRSDEMEKSVNCLQNQCTGGKSGWVYIRAGWDKSYGFTDIYTNLGEFC